MLVKWKNLILITIIWLVSEIFLNFLGIDNLADYGEFIFQRHETISFISHTFK